MKSYLKRGSLLIVVAVGTVLSGFAATIARVPTANGASFAGIGTHATGEKSLQTISHRGIRKCCSFLEAEPARNRQHKGDQTVSESRDRGIVYTSAAAAADVLRRYYEAIDRHDFATAYDLLRPDGGKTKSFTAFREDLIGTKSVHVVVGPPGEIEGAAGSAYVTVPFVVERVLDGDVRQRLTGTCILRRLLTKEAETAVDERWHIFSIDLHGNHQT